MGVSVNIVTVFFYCACFSEGGGYKVGCFVFVLGELGGCSLIFSVDQKKQKPHLGSSLWRKRAMSHTPSTSVPGIGPVSRWLAHPAQGVCSVFWFSFCKDIARKVNNKGKVLRELECGCYGDVLCCE